MSAATRRGALGSLAALSAPALPAVALAGASPDAAVIRVCLRFLALEAEMADPGHPQAAAFFDDVAASPEYRAVKEALDAATPRTPAGWAAVAAAALLCDETIETDGWEGDLVLRMAHKVLRHVAGPATAQEEDRRRLEQRTRRAAALARLDLREVPPEHMPRPVQPTLQEQADTARQWVAAAEAILRSVETRAATAGVVLT